MIELAIFEKYVIRKTCESYMSQELLDEILNKGADNYDYSGCGYFITIKHSKLPKEPWALALHFPPLSGYWNGIFSGFTIFGQDGELTLECFSYGEEEIPSDYRDHRVEINEIDCVEDPPGSGCFFGGKLIHREP